MASRRYYSKVRRTLSLHDADDEDEMMTLKKGDNYENGRFQLDVGLIGAELVCSPAKWKQALPQSQHLSCWHPETQA